MSSSIVSAVLTSVAAFSAAAAAIASFISIRRSKKDRQKENEIRQQEIDDRRPFFMIDLSRVQIKEYQGYFDVTLPITNYGRRPAVDCVSELKILQENGTDATETRKETDLPQTIFPQTDIVCRLDKGIRSIAENYTDHKVICGIRYYDKVLKRYFCQFFVRNWPRRTDGKPGSILTLPSNTEYERLKSKYSAELKKYIDY